MDTPVIDAPVMEPPRSEPAGRLLNRNFLLLWQGQFVSQLGNQAYFVAMMYWTMRATGSGTLMGILMMLAMLPMVIIGPVGGVFADRHSRRAILITADTLRGLAVMVPAVLMIVRPGATDWIVIALLAAGLFGGLVSAVFQPAIAAAVPDLVPPARLAAANSLNQFSNQGALLLGQGIGGILFRLLGAPLLFLADGVTFLFSAVSECFIHIPQTLPEKTTGFRQAFRTYRGEAIAGFRFIWSRPGMRTFLLTATAFNFLAMPVFVLLPFYVDLHLGKGPEWFGFLLAAMGAGSMAGYMVAGILRGRGGVRAAALLTALGATGGVIALLGGVRAPAAALALFGLTGMLTGMINILVMTLFQLATPGEMRGRVMALVMALSGAAAPLGMAAGGILADLTGRAIGELYTGCGVLMVVLTVSMSLRRPLREFLASGAGI